MPPGSGAGAGAISPCCKKAVRDALVEALSGFLKEVAGGSYLSDAEVAGIAKAELEEFRAPSTQRAIKLSCLNP
ncbi:MULTISPECIES: hypothetical protein [unclassified Mesorhizobium]|uniref:hypothetical protein n=1 Tax=unclassified Mesorhizobium TaxID=325217 RepID=UPI001FDEBA42|nr:MULTISPECIES: hypothetical protein [unclassified Mesorhizobium]